MTQKNQNQNYIEINTFLSFIKQIKTSAQNPLGFSLSKRFTMNFPISKPWDILHSSNAFLAQSWI